jgi:DNA-binding NarL/FixJ family response regulator
MLLARLSPSRPDVDSEEWAKAAERLIRTRSTARTPQRRVGEKELAATRRMLAEAALALVQHGSHDRDSWAAMAKQRWTVVERFQHEGKEYVVAVRDDGPQVAFESLTRREQQVVGARLLGHTNKAAAYALGRSASTIRVLLARALRKLGVGSMAELVKRIAS